MFACPTCGTARAPGAVYCHVCGEALPADGAAPAPRPEPVGAVDQAAGAAYALDTQDAWDAQPLAVDAEPATGPTANAAAMPAAAGAPGSTAATMMTAAARPPARVVPWSRLALLAITLCLALSTAAVLFLFAGAPASASPPGGAPLAATPTVGNPFALTPSPLATPTMGTATATATQDTGGGGTGPVPTPRPTATATPVPTALPATPTPVSTIGSQ